MSEPIRVRQARMEFQGLKMEHGPEVDRLVLVGEQLTLTSNPLNLRLGRDGTAEATIGEESLTSYLSTKLPAPISKVEVQLVGGRVQVAAIAKIVFEIRALAMCKLEIVDGREIHVRLESVEPGGPVRTMLEGQLDKVNPVFDVADLPVPAILESTRIEAGQLIVTGKFELAIES